MIAVALGSFNLRRLPFHSIPFHSIPFHSIKMSKKYEICLEWPEFEEYFLENYTLKTVKKYKELYMDDDNACINYWYGDYENGKIQLFWTFSGHEEKIHNVSYTGSSCFAMYWSSLTDGNEEDDEDEEDD